MFEENKLLLWIPMDKLDWGYLSSNPNAIHLLEQNQDKIDWYYLSSNPNAIHLLEQNQDKIDWYELTKNPNAIHLLEQNQDKIDWDELSTNPNAIHLLEQNQEQINWYWLSNNPSIFYQTYNYEKIKTTIGDKIREELMKKLYAPKRVQFMVNTYYDDDYELYWSNTTL
jgi:hypothetical protein